MTTKRKTEEPAQDVPRAPLIALETYLDIHRQTPRTYADVLRALHGSQKRTLQGWQELTAQYMSRGEK